MSRQSWKHTTEYASVSVAQLEAMLPGTHIAVEIDGIWLRFRKTGTGRWALRSRIPVPSSQLANHPVALVAADLPVSDRRAS